MKMLRNESVADLVCRLNEFAEDRQIEAKRDSGNYKSLLETVCSFSNEPGLGGGIILLGIREEEHGEETNRFIVEGVKDPDKAQTDIATQCKLHFNIPVYPDIELVRFQDATVLKIFVPELSDRQKPLYVRSLGLPNGVYRRIGSSDLRCNEDDLRLFYSDSMGYDQIAIPGATVADVDPEAMRRYRFLREKVNPAAEELLYDDQGLLEALGCVCAENKSQLNLAGVLLFGSAKLQRRTIPSMRIDYIRVPGNEWMRDPEASFRSVDVLGPMFLTLYTLIDAVTADLPKGFVLREGELQADSQGLPIRVLREAIVNAMMHRSYREDCPTQIVRYDNRIEITNAGCSLKEPDELGMPGSRLRNRIIAPVFHDTNLAETKGSGIRRMRELMAKAHLAQPTFGSRHDKNDFTVRLLLHHFLDSADLEWLQRFEGDELTDAQKTALIFVREVGAIDNVTYRQIGNCDTLKASSSLRRLRDLGFLVSKGRSTATYYVRGERLRLSENTQAPAENTHAVAENTQVGIENTHAVAENTQVGIENTHAVAENTQAGEGNYPEALIEEIRSLGKWVARQRMEDLIERICAVRPITRIELANLLSRKEHSLKKVLNHLVDSGRINYTHPEMVRHPGQGYTAGTD